MKNLSQPIRQGRLYHNFCLTLNNENSKGCVCINQDHKRNYFWIPAKITQKSKLPPGNSFPILNLIYIQLTNHIWKISYEMNYGEYWVFVVGICLKIWY